MLESFVTCKNWKGCGEIGKYDRITVKHDPKYRPISNKTNISTCLAKPKKMKLLKMSLLSLKLGKTCIQA